MSDPAPLREAARLIAEGLVLEDQNNQGPPHEFVTEWVEAALGPPRAITVIDQWQQIAWFDSVVFLTTESTFTISCATRERLETLLSHPGARKRHFRPARYAYDRLAEFPELGRLLGTLTHPGSICWETLELHETVDGCGVRAMLADMFPAKFEMRPGGVVATVPRHERFLRAAAFGEWQPGLRDPDELRALLEKHHASEALRREVFRADEIVGGFRGARGIELLGPWAGSILLEAMGTSGRVNSFWTQPQHPYNKAWFLGWARVAPWRATVYVDDKGSVWTSWQDPADDDVEYHCVGESVEGWFERQIFLLEHGYASEATCQPADALPAGARLREELSDAVVKVFEDEGAVWLVEERGIQRMSRNASSVAELLAIADRFR